MLGVYGVVRERRDEHEVVRFQTDRLGYQGFVRIQDILIACIDGLSGFPEAILAI